jgi:hypothetical protein
MSYFPTRRFSTSRVTGATGALPTEGTPLTSFSFNLALVLERANDPSGLLTADWASRQKQLAALGSDELWTLYGADPAKYNDVLARLAELGISTVDQIDAVNGYVSSPESRTIWVQVNETNFTTLFGQGATLLRGDGPEGRLTFWKGDLSLPDSLAAAGVKGVVFDTGLFGQVLANPGGGTAASLAQGAQSAGNAVPQEGGIAPNDLAALYGFPFNSGGDTSAVDRGEDGRDWGCSSRARERRCPRVRRVSRTFSTPIASLSASTSRASTSACRPAAARRPTASPRTSMNARSTSASLLP